jgi:hypothetical protein
MCSVNTHIDDYQAVLGGRQRIIDDLQTLDLAVFYHVLYYPLFLLN